MTLDSPPQGQAASAPRSAERPLVSVVVAAYNSERTIARCVDTILAQSYSPLELIVVDDGSRDSTRTLLENHPERARFELLPVPNGGPSLARNLGVAASRGEFLVFFDSDCYPELDCVDQLVSGLDGEDVASVGGVQLSPDDETEFGRQVNNYFRAIGFMTGYMQSERDGAIVETAHNPSCNLLYRRDVLVRLGGFDEGLWPGEDVDLDYRAVRAGYRHRFSPKAAIRHYRPVDMRSLRRMFHSYGRAQMLLLKRYGPFRRLHWAMLTAPLLIVTWAFSAIYSYLLAASVALVASLTLVLISERLRRRARLDPGFHRLLLVNVFCWFLGAISGIGAKSKKPHAA